MIFNTSEDLKKDIINKVCNYLKETIGQNSSIDTKNIVSLLRSYFFELKIRKEVTDSVIGWSDGKYEIEINFKYNEEDIIFRIDLFNELRKLKITKIKNNKNIIEYFI
jgi:CTP:phosphocholine cytidylyltransferase-like protein